MLRIKFRTCLVSTSPRDTRISAVGGCHTRGDRNDRAGRGFFGAQSYARICGVLYLYIIAAGTFR